MWRLPNRIYTSFCVRACVRACLKTRSADSSGRIRLSFIQGLRIKCLKFSNSDLSVPGIILLQTFFILFIMSNLWSVHSRKQYLEFQDDLPEYLENIPLNIRLKCWF